MPPLPVGLSPGPLVMQDCVLCDCEVRGRPVLPVLRRHHRHRLQSEEPRRAGEADSAPDLVHPIPSPVPTTVSRIWPGTWAGTRRGRSALRRSRSSTTARPRASSLSATLPIQWDRVECQVGSVAGVRHRQRRVLPARRQVAVLRPPALPQVHRRQPHREQDGPRRVATGALPGGSTGLSSLFHSVSSSSHSAYTVGFVL